MQHDAYDGHGHEVGALQSSCITAIHGYPPHVRHAHYASTKGTLHGFLNIMTLLGYGSMH
eukprot:4415875-Pyramimonas_sp.AAC.1